MNDGTIGSASSGGTAHANADCQSLFTLLWNNVANTNCPVSGGRGTSAAADWAANKAIALPKALGRALAIAGLGAGLSTRNLGDTLGEETHTLTQAEMPNHSHGASSYSVTNPGGGSGCGGDAGSGGGSGATYAVDGTSGAAGSGGAHNNMQPTSFLNVMINL